MSRRSTRFTAALAVAMLLVALSAAGVLAGEVRGARGAIPDTPIGAAPDDAPRGIAALGGSVMERTSPVERPARAELGSDPVPVELPQHGSASIRRLV